MMNPVRAATGWFAGRLLVFLAILAALVAMDAYREESTLLGVMLKGLVPDRELVQRLEDSRIQIEEFARDAELQVNQRLRDAQSAGPARIDALIESLRTDIRVKEGRRRSSTAKAIALMTGAGLEEDLKNEVDIQLSRAELEALKRIKGEFEALRTESRDAAVDFEDKRRAHSADQRSLPAQEGRNHSLRMGPSNSSAAAGHRRERSACGTDNSNAINSHASTTLRARSSTQPGTDSRRRGRALMRIPSRCDWPALRYWAHSMNSLQPGSRRWRRRKGRRRRLCSPFSTYS